MPKAVVIGGRGQCGLAIAQRLIAAGWSVTSTTGGPEPSIGICPGVRWVPMVRDQVDDLADVVSTGTDVVVDTTAMTAVHARQLLDLGDRVGSAVVLSTLSVYSDDAGRSLDDAADDASFPDWPVPIPEDWPTVRPGDTGYSARKSAVETLLREQTGLPVTLLRLGAVHGPHSHHLREWYFVKRVLDRRARVVLPYGGKSVFQTIATINLAEMVALAAAKPGHRTLNCADERPPSVVEISAAIDDLMGWSTRAALVSGPPPRPTVGEHPWCVPRPVVADMALARTSLGYSEVASYRDALSRTVPWVVDACSGRDWRDVLTTLARYPNRSFRLRRRGQLPEHLGYARSLITGRIGGWTLTPSPPNYTGLRRQTSRKYATNARRKPKQLGTANWPAKSASSDGRA